MQPVPRHSGEMSQNSVHGGVHPTPVDADGTQLPVLDPAARRSRRMYEGLSASAAGLELGISVAIGALFGAWLDGKLGTAPWLLIAFLIVGVIAGFRGVLRAVARAERADRAERIQSRRSGPGKGADRHG
jgi:ATP synthase protein I